MRLRRCNERRKPNWPLLQLQWEGWAVGRPRSQKTCFFILIAVRFRCWSLGTVSLTTGWGNSAHAFFRLFSLAKIYLHEGTMLGSISSYTSTLPCFQVAQFGLDQIQSVVSSTASFFTGPNEAASLKDRNVTAQSSELHRIISKTPQDLNAHWDDYLKDVSGIILNHVDQKAPPEVKKDLENLFEKLTYKNIQLFFDHIVETSLDKDIPNLPDATLELFSLEKIVAMLKERHPGKFTNAKDWAATVAGCLPEELPPLPEPMPQEEKASRTNVITSFFPNLGHIFMRAFDLFDTARPPESLYEYGVLVTLYINFFAMPYYMCYALSAVVAGPWMVLLVALLILAVSVGTLYVHLRWFKKCPDEVMFCENISKKYQRGELEPVIGREREYEQVKACLGIGQSRKKGNVVLIGEPGVGKTEFMHGLAERLQGYQILKFKNWALFGAGGSVLGPGEKMDMAFKEVRGYEDKNIFCYDELGDGMKNSGFVDYLRQVLPNTNIRFVAAMTKKQWEKLIAENSEKGFEERFTIEERFTPIFFDPSDEIQTERFLSERVRRYAGEMQIAHKSLKKIIELTNKHREGHAQPRNAIKALDEQMGKVLQFHQETYSTPELRSALDALRNLKAMSIAPDSPLDIPFSNECDSYLKQVKEARSKIDELEKAVEHQKKLIGTMTRYLRYLKTYQEARTGLATLLAGQEGGDKMDQKKFLFSNFMALPRIHAMVEKMSEKLNRDVYLRIDEASVKEAIKPKPELAHPGNNQAL